MDPRIILSGEAPDGWLIDIHDGDNAAVYSPVASDAEAALNAAIKSHNEKFGVKLPINPEKPAPVLSAAVSPPAVEAAAAPSVPVEGAAPAAPIENT